ncbi:FAD dependent oxidoreductase [Cercophora scortea]|uniref:FAD dependent oxidoreductase n=1 Tax=Cercophora scortea TaxID=314031 RepID=A0AAE0J3Z4_9PEZI|nr:FAD dependent oxidoreductase [Cercophora scortea]
MPKHIVVIGAGVIGLSSALLLLQSEESANYTVTLLARDFPAPFETIDPLAHINYTSPWGGAHNRWVPPTASGEGTREHAFALATFARMRALADEAPGAAAGITFMKGVEYLENPGAEYAALEAEGGEYARWALGMEGFRILGREEFPDERVKWGCEYDTWCVNPMVYCAFLLRRFVLLGGRVVRGEVRGAVEAFSFPFKDGIGEKVDAVVNATGVGFGDDENVFITRGQTCLVAEPCDATVTRQNADGSWTFSVPRGFDGGTVIGGTKEPDNWDARPSAEVREQLLERFVATYPKILEGTGREKLTVVRDIVGRRPTRKGGLRLEGEVLPGGRFVMHAYGLGGRGFELSWGVAEGVVEGVRKYFAGEEVKV